MGRVGVCMLLCCSQIHNSHMVAQKQAQGLGGLGCAKKPKDLSASEREERGRGEGVGVYATLMQSDIVQPYGRAKAGTRPVGLSCAKDQRT